MSHWTQFSNSRGRRLELRTETTLRSTRGTVDCFTSSRICFQARKRSSDSRWMAARMRLTDSRRICSHSSELQWATAAVQEERTITRSWGIFSPTWLNQSMEESSERATVVEGCIKFAICDLQLVFISRGQRAVFHRFWLGVVGLLRR